MLILKKELLKRITKHALSELPNEACGILAGSQERSNGSTPLTINSQRSRRVKKVYEMLNTEKSPSTFFMEPKEQLKVMKEIRPLGLEMIGIYHSHVATEAYPSAHDVEMAFYPEVSYIIVSLKDKNNPSVRSFKIAEGKITEEEIEIR